MKRVSIVILNWNGKRYLEQFLPGLVAHSQVEGAEIVVADNASSDGSADYLESEFPGIRLIRLEKNYGFSGGYNRALEQLNSKYFLLLNSDIEVSPGWLDPLLDHMEAHENCGACSPKIRDYRKKTHFEYAGAAGGYLDKYGYPFCRGRIFDRLEEDQGQYDQVREVMWGSGACLMVRSALFRKAGGLDEAFFAHMEEIDLCWRLHRMGSSVCFIPGSVVYHVGGGTLSRGNPMKTFLNFRNNLLLLYKNLPQKGRRRILFTRLLLDGVSALRFLVQGAWIDFWAVCRAHRAYFGMKRDYDGMGNHNLSGQNDVIRELIYPHSVVVDFFLRGRKEFRELKWTRSV
jgi:GT2 family glycosyltransferase